MARKTGALRRANAQTERPAVQGMARQSDRENRRNRRASAQRNRRNVPVTR